MPDETAVWRALPARMPGMVPSVVAARFPGVPLHEITRMLNSMVDAGTAIRRASRGHDVYYRCLPPAQPAPAGEEAAQPDLFTGTGP